jgi:hypothetical protein
VKMSHLLAQASTTIADGSTTTTAAEGSVVTPEFGPWAVALGVGVLFFFAVLVMVVAWIRTWKWNDSEGMGKLRGLALPSGTVRSVLALLVVGGFILFAFTGRGIVGDNEQFTAVLAAWVTLTGTVTGFYFGSRVGQTLDTNNQAAAGGGEVEADPTPAPEPRTPAEPETNSGAEPGTPAEPETNFGSEAGTPA